MLEFDINIQLDLEFWIPSADRLDILNFRKYEWP